MKKAIFWDRDGTLIEHRQDSYYTVLPDQITLKSGIKSLVRLQDEYLFFIVTNAGGVGKGDYSVDQFWEGQNFFEQQCAKKGIWFEKCWPSFWNPKNPGHMVEYETWRKPETKIITETLKLYPDIDLSKSWVVGDSNVDIEMGQRANCRTIFIQDPNNKGGYGDLGDLKPDFIVDHLEKVTDLILD